ncbi:MAG: hypothetical protein ACRD1C_07545 [Terriglobales bacterium]
MPEHLGGICRSQQRGGLLWSKPAVTAALVETTAYTVWFSDLLAGLKV